MAQHPDIAPVIAGNGGNRRATDPAGMLDVLEVTARGTSFCVDLRDVVKVIHLVALRPIPSAPHHLIGLMNLAGSSVPVIDLAERLGLTNTQPYDLHTPIVLCSVVGKCGGLIVSDVVGVESVHPRDVQMDDIFHGDISPIKGVVNLAGVLSLLLNLRLVLSFDMAGNAPGLQIDPELLAHQERQS